MKKREKQTVYLAYLRYDKTTSSIEGYVQKAQAVNTYNDDFPIWDDIEYGMKVRSFVSSYEGYYAGVGPWGEPCRIFTTLEKAVKKLFEDIHGYCKYCQKMEHYDILRPNVFSADVYPSIYYGDGTSMRLIEAGKIIDALGGEPLLLDK